MQSSFNKYFGTEPGGDNLFLSSSRLPIASMQNFRRAMAALPHGGRLIFMGNGGSFDNARQMAAWCRRAGIPAKTPGHPDDYFSVAQTEGYGEIFAYGLRQDHVGPSDIVVGISGSGNSENILKAFESAKAADAQIFCFGGRDGGKMRVLCGEENSMVAPNECMEAIEDLHMIMMLAVLRSLCSEDKLSEIVEEIRTHLSRFLSESNIAKIAETAAKIRETVAHHGMLYILGTCIGSNHIRADLNRGATNAIPLRGIAAPEFFSMNSAQATANDDGPDFILADGLIKFSPKPSDFAVLCETDGIEFSLCREILEDAGTPFMTLGHADITMDFLPIEEREIVVPMVGHACGRVLRSLLQEELAVRKLPLRPEFPAGQKKFGAKSTKDLEARLKAEGVLSPTESLVFCYGECFAATLPEEKQGHRCFY